MSEPVRRKPEWLKAKSNTGLENTKVMEMLRSLHLHTVCEEAGCPNCGECFGKRTATFMILGRNCTRNCTFCTVSKAIPSPVDETEPQHIAEAVKQLGLRHVVITSVTRDDLPDGGAAHFVRVIEVIRAELYENPPVVEVLIPDFQGNTDALNTVLRAKPDVLNHNIETVPRLYPEVRPMAVYDRSLALLSNVRHSAPDIVTKSGIMLGLGETREEVLGVLHDLRANGCDLLTIGQYLAPSSQHHPVIEYVHPDVFAEYRQAAEEIGFLYTASGPLVRSSYLAGEVFEQMKTRQP